MILAGDKNVREFGTHIGLAVRGLFHVFDLIEEAGAISVAALYSSLLTISGSKRARLPVEEVQERLERYASQSMLRSA